MNEKEQNNNISEEAIVQPSYEIVGIRFKTTGKIYYFDPQGLQLEIGSDVIVETARGLEFGKVVIPNRVVGEDKDRARVEAGRGCGYAGRWQHRL